MVSNILILLAYPLVFGACALSDVNKTRKDERYVKMKLIKVIEHDKAYYQFESETIVALIKGSWIQVIEEIPVYNLRQ